MIRETYLRTVYKTIVYRIFAVLSVSLLAYALSGSFDAAFQVGAIVIFAGSAIYFLHDRIWSILNIKRRAMDGEELRVRSLAKTITYRAIIFVIAFFVGATVVSDGDPMIATYFSIGQGVLNFLCYYFVERIFNRYKVGVDIDI